MTSAEIQTTCDVLADAAPAALVVASPLSWDTGGHVTVVHHRGQADLVDAALDRAGLRSERVDETRTKVLGGKLQTADEVDEVQQ